MVKMVCVLAGRRRYGRAHRAKAPKTKGIFAGVASLASVAALVLGVALAG